MSTKNTDVSKPKKKKCICTIIIRKGRKQEVLNKPYIRQIGFTYPTRTVVGNPLLNFF